MRDIFRRRKEHGDFHNLVRELQLADRDFILILSFSCNTAVSAAILELRELTEQDWTLFT